MKFSIYRILKRLRSQKIIYFVIALQLAIGASLLCFSFNKYFTEKTKFDEISKSISASSTLIEANAARFNTPKQEAVTFDDYNVLQKMYKDNISLNYSRIGNISFMSLTKDKLNNEVITINVIFMSSEELETLFEEKVEKDTYYGGEIAIKYISDMTGYTKEKVGVKLSANTYYSLTTDIAEFKDNGISIDDNLYTFKSIPQLAQKKKMFTRSSQAFSNEDGLTLENCLFFPLEEINLSKSLWTAYDASILSRLSVQEKNPQDGVAFEIVEYLSKEHKDEYTYSLGNEYMQAKLQLDYITSAAKGYMLISILQILLISFCSAGIFYLIFVKRKKDISISIMVGSTLKRQIFELVFEILIVIFTGLSSGFLFFCFSNGSVMAIEKSTIVVLLSLGVVTAIISTSLALKDLYGISPVEILQKN